MQIYLARDGTEIGEYPREQLETRARNGELRPNDYYWHEGMPDWLLLGDLLGPDAWKPKAPAPRLETPPPRTPIFRHRLALPVTLGTAFVLALLLVIVLIKSGGADKARTSLPTPPPRPGESEEQVRDKAAADLRQKIDRLPARAAAPLNTFYYDVNVNMRKSLERHTPWTATIAGDENQVDPASQETTLRTQFTLNTDYHDGSWVYRNYHAVVTDLRTQATTEIYDDENAPTPPSIVGMLGLKRERH